jgi:hypothetical protein
MNRDAAVVLSKVQEKRGSYGTTVPIVIGITEKFSVVSML